MKVGYYVRIVYDVFRELIIVIIIIIIIISLKEKTFGYFPENLGLFRFVSVFYETVLFVSVVSI